MRTAILIQKMKMINHSKVLTVIYSARPNSSFTQQQPLFSLDDSSDYDSEEVSNVVVGEDNSEDSDDAQEEEDKDDENDDEEDADENAEGVEGLRSKIRFRDIMKHGPGMDSGCTAVVAILRGNELYVANAGDSRCVVCRSGKCKIKDTPRMQLFLLRQGCAHELRPQAVSGNRV